MREASTNLIYDLAKSDSRIIAITADGRNGVYERIKNEMPTQYIDYGIAEQNMVASSAGLACCGKIPFVFGTSTFLAMRAFEFIRNDVCIPNMNVKFLGIFSGLSRTCWGATHQGTEEIALLRCLPNLLVITPSSPIQAREATRYAYEHYGPVYIRLEASGEKERYDDSYRFFPGKAKFLFGDNKTSDIVIVTMGSVVNLAIEVAEEMRNHNIKVGVLDEPTTKPIDKDSLYEIINQGAAIMTLEEHSIYGGLGSSVAEVIAESGQGVRFLRMGLDGCAQGCGSIESVRRKNDIHKDNIIDSIENLLKR